MDIPLNENGKDQARKTFEYLRNISFNKAFSSSMHRPYETAQIILQNNKDLKIEKIDSLCLLYTSPSPRDVEESRMPSSA